MGCPGRLPLKTGPDLHDLLSAVVPARGLQSQPCTRKECIVRVQVMIAPEDVWYPALKYFIGRTRVLYVSAGDASSSVSPTCAEQGVKGGGMRQDALLYVCGVSCLFMVKLSSGSPANPLQHCHASWAVYDLMLHGKHGGRRIAIPRKYFANTPHHSLSNPFFLLYHKRFGTLIPSSLSP